MTSWDVNLLCCKDEHYKVTEEVMAGDGGWGVVTALVLSPLDFSNQR